MSSRERLQAARSNMRPPSAPPNAGIKRKERDYDQDTGDETNINVVVRCRGRNEREVRENSGVVVGTSGVKSKTVELLLGPNAISNKSYHFDKVFSQAADQAIIFEDVVLPILNEMLAGFNCTIFAYGQTGTGKTYTMSGDMTDTLGILPDAAGIIPRVLYSLFQKLENDGAECTVKCSFIELYNEELRDLLSADDGVKLKIYDDSNRKTHSATVVQGMEETHIKSATAGISLLQQGSHRRQVAATKCNDLSSRSHTVFTITTYVKKPGDSGDDYICSGKLNLVDLAGSENIQRSGAENKRAAEAGLINKSLLTLGRVINALVDKSAHIPYRESKLTRLLQDSLGGRTKTCIIATVSPAKSNLEETISTLDYAFRAKNIRNKPQVNTMISKKTLLREFTTEIEKLKSELIATRQRNGVYLTNEQFEEMTVQSESRRILSEEQKARIDTMETSLRNKVQDLFNLTNNFSILKKDNDVTKAALEATRDILVKTDLVLKDTQKTLEEETQLRKAHAATELKLRDIGSHLVSTVGESLQDIEGLNAKLRRRSALHHQNEHTWNSSASHVSEIAKAIDSQLTQMKEQFSEQLEALSARLDEFLDDEQYRARKGQETIKTISIDYNNRSQNLESSSSESRDGMNEVLEEIKTLREDVKSKVGEGLRGLSDAAARISGEVISELDQFHTQLHASYSGLGKDFKQMFDEIMKELTTQRAESDRLRNALKEAHTSSMHASLMASTNLESCLTAERKAAEEEKEDLMQHISALITASHSKRDERLSRAIIDVKGEIVEAAEDLERVDQAYNVDMDQWAVQDSNLIERINTSRETLKTRMKNDWTAVETRNSAIQESTKAVHQETVKIVDAQMHAMATQMADLDEFVTRARQHNDSNHDSNLANIKDLSTQLNALLSTASKEFTAEPAQNLNIELQEHHFLLDQLLTTLHNNVQNPIEHLHHQFSDSSLTPYAPTGETPQKREWNYPTDLPVTIKSSTPPPKPIMSTHRTQTPSRFRSPQKSPRKSPKKMTSPRKIVKEIYVDSPMAIPPAPPTIHRSASAKSVPTIPTSLKEVDVNANNHTICLPITHEDENKGKVDFKEKPSIRLPPSRSGRSTRNAQPLSVSVGVGTENAKTKGKENFNPIKSVSTVYTGRRLRSSPLPPEQ